MGLVIPRHALNVFSQTGHAPDTPRWNMLEARMELNPGRFTFYHPTLAPLLTDATCIGRLPEGKFYDGLRGRYQLNPDRFTHYHPLLGKLLERDANAREHCSTCGPNPIPSKPPSVSPEVLVPPTDTVVTIPGTTKPTDPTEPTDPVLTAPEPAAFIQLGIGLICIGAYSVFKRKKNAYLRTAPAWGQTQGNVANS